MRTIKYFFVIVGLALCLSLQITYSALAHGSHQFRSVEELTEHIESHIAKGEEVLSQKPLDSAFPLTRPAGALPERPGQGQIGERR